LAATSSLTIIASEAVGAGYIVINILGSTGVTKKSRTSRRRRTVYMAILREVEQSAP
jgi:hypothetical protein